MQTDDLVELLVKDLVPWRFRSILAGAVAGGIIIAAALAIDPVELRLLNALANSLVAQAR